MVFVSGGILGNTVTKECFDGETVCDDEDLLSFFVKVVGHESLSVKMHSVESIQVTFHLMSLLESFQEISILFIELLEAFLMVVISHHLSPNHLSQACHAHIQI